MEGVKKVTPTVGEVTEVKAIGEVTIVEAKEKLTAKEVMPEERWNSLIEDCREIICEHIVRSREAVIEMKWHLGDRLLEEGEEAISHVIQRVSEELKMSQTDLWYCLAFRKRFSRLEELWEKAPEGKNISWHKLVNHYINFTTPKPEVPVEEKEDTFGLIEWWKEQGDLQSIWLVSKSADFKVLVKKGKQEKIKPEVKQGMRDTYYELDHYYIKLKRWDNKDLSRNDYARMHRSLKELLEKAKLDKEKVKKAIKWCHDNYGTRLEWSLETVCKKYAEAQREIKPHEKYLKPAK
jgi:hypothetical protein